MWNLPDIHLKIFGEVSAGSKVHHLFGVALQLPMNKAEDTGKYLQMHVILEPALLLYMLSLSIALKTSQFQTSKMKPGLYNTSNGRQ